MKTILKMMMVMAIIILFFTSCKNKTVRLEYPLETTEKQESNMSITENKPIEKPKNVTVNLNEPADYESLRITAKNIREHNMEDDLMNAAEEGFKYVAVQVSLENTGDNLLKINREDFVLIDNNGAEYVEETKFTEHRKKPVLLGGQYDSGIELETGQVKSGWITFEIEKEAQGKTLKYKNVEIKI